jgi:hypothetical protein
MAATALPVMPWLARQARYRCHGYTSATSPDRPANLYVREDQILPRLAALAISQAGSSGWLRCTKQAIVQVTSPAQAAELTDQHGPTTSRPSTTWPRGPCGRTSRTPSPSPSARSASHPAVSESQKGGQRSASAATAAGGSG